MLLFEREIEHNDLFAIYKLIKMQATDGVCQKSIESIVASNPGQWILNTIVIMSNMCQRIEVQKPKKKNSQNHHLSKHWHWERLRCVYVCVRATRVWINIITLKRNCNKIPRNLHLNIDLYSPKYNWLPNDIETPNFNLAKFNFYPS